MDTIEVPLMEWLLFSFFFFIYSSFLLSEKITEKDLTSVEVTYLLRTEEIMQFVHVQH